LGAVGDAGVGVDVDLAERCVGEELADPGGVEGAVAVEDAGGVGEVQGGGHGQVQVDGDGFGQRHA
jgi:hypothetical protein